MEPVFLLVAGLLILWVAATGRVESVWKALKGK